MEILIVINDGDSFSANKFNLKGDNHEKNHKEKCISSVQNGNLGK